MAGFLVASVSDQSFDVTVRVRISVFNAGRFVGRVYSLSDCILFVSRVGGLDFSAWGRRLIDGG